MTLFQKIRSFAENRPGTFWFFSFTVLCSLALIGLEAVKLDVRFMYIVEDISEYGIRATATINGNPYPDYPSTWIVFAWLTSLCGHFLNRWTMCLPSILSGALTAVLICRTGEKVQKGLGHIAVLIAISSFEFMSVFLGFGLDAPVCACGAAMLYLLLEEKNHLFRTHLLFALLLIIGFSIRGPIGAILIGTGTAAWLLAERRWIGLVSYGAVGAVSFSACIGAIYLILHWQGGEELWNLCREWQVGNRMDTRGIDYTFYLLQSYTMYCPSSLPLLFTLLFGRRRLFSRPVFGWIAYLLAIELLLTIPGCQHLRYMTLGVPAMALIGAWGLLNIRFPLSHKVLSVMTLTASVIVRIACFVLIFACLITAVVYYVLGFGVCYVMLIGAFLAILLTCMVWKLVPLKLWYSFASFAVGGCLATLFLANAIISTNEQTSPSVRVVEDLVGNGSVYFYHIDADHDGIKYLIFIDRDRVKKVFFVDPDCSDLTRNMYQVIYNLPSDLSDAYVIVRDGENGSSLPGDPDWKNPEDYDALMNEVHDSGLSLRGEIVRKIRLGHKSYDLVHLSPGK